MLIKQTRTDNQVLELHHLGRLSLDVQVRNPHPQEPIPNWQEEVMYGPIYFDSFFWRRLEHDFYYAYEKIYGRKSVIEKVSFTKPVNILSNKYDSRKLMVMIAGLDPHQHPAVTDYDYDSELAGFDIPGGYASFYGWEYRKVTHKHSVRRSVKSMYACLIDECLNGIVLPFIPGDLFEPLYKNAPRYVLEVLDMIDFGLLDVVPPGYHEYFKPRLSQKLLEAPRSLV